MCKLLLESLIRCLVLLLCPTSGLLYSLLCREMQEFALYYLLHLTLEKNLNIHHIGAIFGINELNCIYSKEIIGSSAFQRSSFLNPNPIFFTVKNSVCFELTSNILIKKKMVTRQPPVAAISDDVVKLIIGQKVVNKLKVRASMTVRRKNKEDVKETIANQFDALSDKIGRNVVLELISTDINSRTKSPYKSGEEIIKDWYEKKNTKGERVTYTTDFMIDPDFGLPGAVTMLNRHQKEFFLECIVVDGFPSGSIHFPCNSWVQSTKDLPTKRVFFTNKPYLPLETPDGLRELREKELKELRGDRKGTRKQSDRIYDYDIYNDLGNPDKGREYMRPILGGDKLVRSQIFKLAMFCTGGS